MAVGCFETNQKLLKLESPKKSRSEILGTSSMIKNRQKTNKSSVIKESKSKNSINNYDYENLSSIFNNLDVGGGCLPNDEELGIAFDKFWDSVKTGLEKNCTLLGPDTTSIDSKMSQIHNRIMYNQEILKSANEKLKSINFQTEKQNFNMWRDNMYKNNSNENDGSNSRKIDIKALDLEIEKLKRRKSDKNVFLKSSPGVSNFHKTMETTLNMLDKIQNVNEFQDNNYDSNINDIKNDFHLSYIKSPDVIAVSDEE
ncbi:hypothetical protein Phum_PHUM433710 [Pediculus humanus corporis]|uniref:Uncharacterized protein n=1 Tax=Pediculus humanus subsp. corporis TaxID=121224 RepID=E0VTK2_PEDHC|nr:uncharacterized protein Phum_PHUM433710 [Pediculus humanus corporis]EEB16729.1 hypothetical protein Phum_PHUM433710 [Pediculus humanus corporis]